MTRFFQHTSVFNYSWDQVAQGFWKRYPNPESKHVLSEDTIHREVKSGILFTKRLLSKTNSAPKWAERFIKIKQVHVIEESIVDPVKRELITYTRNLGYTKIMSIVEKVIYRENAEHPGKTIAVRTAWIDSQVRGFSRAICAFGHERFKKNCNKMVGGFDYVLASLFPQQNSLQNSHPVAVSAASKIKDAAKSASDLAKAKAVPIYASLHPNQS